MRRDVFHAIADPTRRAILNRIAVEAMTPNTLAESFKSSRQAVSKHLRVLAECRLVKQKQSGREIYYHIDPHRLKEVDQWLDSFRQLWESRFSQLDELINHLKNKKT